MESDTAIGRRVSLLFVLFLLLMWAPDAEAQRKGRGNTTRSDSTRAIVEPAGRRNDARPDRNSEVESSHEPPGAVRGDRSTGRVAPERTGTRGRTIESPSRDAVPYPSREPSAEGRREDVRRERPDRDEWRQPELDSEEGRRSTRNRDRHEEWYTPERNEPGLHVQHRPFPPYYNRPRVPIDLDWPWEYRYHRGWDARYEFRQVVYLENRWHWQGRDTRLDIRTRYHHRVRSANQYRAEVDIYIDEILIYEDAHFLGVVDRIPSSLSRVRATVYRGGGMDIDRSIFVVGDPHAGFELVNTSYYDGYVLSRYGYARGHRIGVLDFRHARVTPVRRPRLFVPHNFDRFLPISLLPEDRHVLYDYGYGSASAYLHGRPGYHYYGGAYEDYDVEYYVEYGEPRGNTGYSQLRDGRYSRHEARGNTEPLSGHGSEGEGQELSVGRTATSVRHSHDENIQTERGASVRVRRETELKRLE